MSKLPFKANENFEAPNSRLLLFYRFTLILPVLRQSAKHALALFAWKLELEKEGPNSTAKKDSTRAQANLIDFLF